MHYAGAGNLVLVTAASGGSSLFAQHRPFAILKPKNRKMQWGRRVVLNTDHITTHQVAVYLS
jgi:hypothetical protein